MLLSVVIPVHNTKPYLKQLFASFQTQTVQNFELVVVDDASTDGSKEWLFENVGAIPWVKLFSRPHGGLSATRNFGIAQCQGEVVALVDSDDWVAENFVEETLKPFRRTSCLWTVRPVYLVFEEGIFVNQTRYDEAELTADETGCFVQADTFEKRLEWWPSVWNKAFRREMISQNWFDEGTIFEDHAFNLRNYALENRFLFLPQPLYYHRREREGQITAAAGAKNHQIFRCFDIWEDAIRNLRLEDKPSYLQGLANRLFHERLSKFSSSGEQAEFEKRFDAWLSARGLLCEPDITDGSGEPEQEPTRSKRKIKPFPFALFHQNNSQEI